MTEVARNFGAEFADALEALPRGEWAGPVESGFGIHLVRVDGWIDARVPALEEVRAAVLRDWQSEQARSAKDEFYQALRGRYEVVLELPDAVGAGASSGASQR
jgi:parvulin-like peptidyl-prolyl isomerase